MGWSLDDMEEMERIGNQGVTLNRYRLRVREMEF